MSNNNEEVYLPSMFVQIPHEEAFSKLNLTKGSPLTAAITWLMMLQDTGANEQFLDMISYNKEQWGDYSTAYKDLSKLHVYTGDHPKDTPEIKHIILFEVAGNESTQALNTSAITEYYDLTLLFSKMFQRWSVWGYSKNCTTNNEEVIGF